ncbi:hypothetical protein like AT4G33985 [Hibiscus trionum]|uniref:Uncharacterized protein n=1 Tax=Hibiscus trionum TaxID=183268 RepID=A0A9W7HBQ6_HIBTR|nr:hypothetical protein like AT4G33985 [Hibiscus trionum]
MPRLNRPPPPPPPQQKPRPLYKQRSWSPDVERDEAWLRRKESHGGGLRRSQSFSNDDLEELKGCIELGFGFETDSPELDPKLSDTLPALLFYCAVNRQYSGRLQRTSSASSIGSSCESGNTSNIIDHCDDPETVKTRLRQWAQVVACSVQQFSGNPN